MVRYRKFITAVLGAALSAVSLGLLDGTAAKWVTVSIAFATSLGVYTVPNSENT